MRRVCIFLLCFPAVLQAAVTAQVDRQQLLLGESLTLEVVSDGANTTQPDFSLLSDVFDVGHVSTSSSTQMYNGQVVQQVMWQVMLIPKTAGEHTIPPLDVNGEMTRPIAIQVKQPDPNAKAKGDLFIELALDKTTAFVQEQVVLTVRLLYAVNVRSGSLSEPDADGLIVHQLGKGSNYTTQRDGRSYQVLERRYALFAEQSGPMQIKPLVFTGEVVTSERRAYSLFQPSRRMQTVSEPLQLEIKQIPQDQLDVDWLPAKQLLLEQTWDHEGPYKAGEPIGLTLSITARGLEENQLPDLQVTAPEGFKVYSDTTDTITQNDGQDLLSRKIMKFALIPSRAGRLEYPGMSLPWYNSVSNHRAEARVDGRVFEVLPGDGLAVTPAKTAGQTAAQSAPELSPAVDANGALPAPDQPASIGSAALWKPAFFASLLLWVLSALWLWRRGAKAGQPTAPDESAQRAQARPLRAALKQSDPHALQQALINWWNHHSDAAVTNLGQIRNAIADEEIIAALDALQAQLYGRSDAAEAGDRPWAMWARSGRLQPAAPPQAKTSTVLPPLYR